jgi:hypothetical protein
LSMTIVSLSQCQASVDVQVLNVASLMFARYR